MAGRLPKSLCTLKERVNAVCPCCGKDLFAIMDTTHITTTGQTPYIEREYYHARASNAARRSRRCKVTFIGPTGVTSACEERNRLEGPLASRPAQ